MTIPYRTKKCVKCGNEDAKQWGTKVMTAADDKVIDIYYDGPYWCNTCDESFCDDCGSHNLESYDDGEGYPPNILCKDCGHWPQ